MTGAAHVMFSAVLLSVGALQASEVRVCIEDLADIGAPGRAGLVRELHSLLPRLDLDVKAGGCDGRRGVDVLLTVMNRRAGIPGDALGLAYRGQGVILPRLEVFVAPVLQLTGVGDKETLGRALARVAAHELLHYQRQTDAHRKHGLMSARLSSADLLSEELRPRLIASLDHD